MGLLVVFWWFFGIISLITLLDLKKDQNQVVGLFELYNFLIDIFAEKRPEMPFFFKKGRMSV